MSPQQNTPPRIEWKDNQWSVTLPLEDGRLVNATWKPGITFVVRIREAGAEDWSCGFETPIATLTFIDFKPDTEYEVQVPSRGAAGEGPPAFFNVRTDPLPASLSRSWKRSRQPPDGLAGSCCGDRLDCSEASGIDAAGPLAEECPWRGSSGGTRTRRTCQCVSIHVSARTAYEAPAGVVG